MFYSADNFSGDVVTLKVSPYDENQARKNILVQNGGAWLDAGKEIRYDFEEV